MGLSSVKIGNLSVSKLILGGNPFSGFSHISTEKDLEMKRYYKVAKIKDEFAKAEHLNINTFLGRADHHVMRTLLEYWDEGGEIQWIAQTCPGVGQVDLGIFNAYTGGAKACYIHGGQMEYFFAKKKLDRVSKYIDMIRNMKMVAGIAAHDPRIIEWAKDNIDVDFYMCSHYHPSNRGENPKHDTGVQEFYNEEDREYMVNLIQKLKKPAIHYKVLAAGRNNPKDTFEFLSKYLRPQDAVCIGIYSKDKPNMLEENLNLLQSALKKK
jgi:hypothetical protein